MLGVPGSRETMLHSGLGCEAQRKLSAHQVFYHEGRQQTVISFRSTFVIVVDYLLQHTVSSHGWTRFDQDGVLRHLRGHYE